MCFHVQDEVFTVVHRNQNIFYFGAKSTLWIKGPQRAGSCAPPPRLEKTIRSHLSLEGFAANSLYYQKIIRGRREEMQPLKRRMKFFYSRGSKRANISDKAKMLLAEQFVLYYTHTYNLLIQWDGFLNHLKIYTLFR